MVVSYKDLCSSECIVSDIVSYHHIWDNPTEYNYEQAGRVNNLLYYQFDNSIDYYVSNKKLCTIEKHDIIFIPNKFRYTSIISGNNESPTSGIGITFNIRTPDGEPIDFSDGLKKVFFDENEQIYQRFTKILYSVLHPNTSMLKLKGQIYTLLDELFKDRDKSKTTKKIREDIANAISVIENYPQRNYSNSQLAEMCFMSESSFMRKFKAYSGGITPLQYRNNIRLMRAEDLIYTTKTIEEIAELLGFYDAAHLCRIYKQSTGHTLKKKQ